MSGPAREIIGHNTHYEMSNDQRLALIDDMNQLHDNNMNMHPRMFDRATEELAHRATELCARVEVYPMQVYGIATQLAALNPTLAPIAEAMIASKFSDEIEQRMKSKADDPEDAQETHIAESAASNIDTIDPITHDSIEVVNKTKEYSIETDDDTITLSRIAITASMDYMQEQIKMHPASQAMQKLADSHNQTPQQHMAEAAPDLQPDADIIELQTGLVPIAQPQERHGLHSLQHAAGN